MGKYDRFWEMRIGGKRESDEAFKCTGCGGETFHQKGFDGEPSVHNCKPGCPCRESDLKTVGNRGYRGNFDRIFPNAPGAGV